MRGTTDTILSHLLEVEIDLEFQTIREQKFARTGFRNSAIDCHV